MISLVSDCKKKLIIQNKSNNILQVPESGSGFSWYSPCNYHGGLNEDKYIISLFKGIIYVLQYSENNVIKMVRC